MASIIKVNTSRLGSDADKVQSSISQMRKQMETMKVQVSQLDKMWDGPSSEAFKNAFHDDMNMLNTILKNLDKIYKFEVNAKKKYEKCEKQVGSIISGIHV